MDSSGASGTSPCRRRWRIPSAISKIESSRMGSVFSASRRPTMPLLTTSPRPAYRRAPVKPFYSFASRTSFSMTALSSTKAGLHKSRFAVGGNPIRAVCSACSSGAPSGCPRACPPRHSRFFQRTEATSRTTPHWPYGRRSPSPLSRSREEAGSQRPDGGGLHPPRSFRRSRSAIPARRQSIPRGCFRRRP